MKKQFLIVGLAITLFACSSPLDKKFNQDTMKEDLEAVSSKIDSTDKMLMAGSLIRLKFEDKNLEEMTYGEILENGKAWRLKQDQIEAEQKALAEKAAKEESERIDRLHQAVMVSCYEKGYTEYDYQDYLTYKFVIKNKSDKTIRAVKGKVTFTNLFDDEISSLSFVYDQPIEAGKEISWNATTDYNQFTDSDIALRNKDLKDLKVVWKPERIIFEDGTSLE